MKPDLDNNLSRDCLDHFSEKAGEWGKLYERPSFMDRLGLFVRAIEGHADRNARVLDYGCGSGIISRKVAERGYTVIGVDGSTGMIQAACEGQQQVGCTNPVFECIDTTSWATDSDSFDAIICSSVLEYVEDDVLLLRKLIAGLKTGGVLLLSVPNRASLVGWFEDCVRKAQKILGLKSDRDVIHSHRRYSERELGHLMSKEGCKIRESCYFEFPIFGAIGVRASRVKGIGVMLFLVIEKIR